MQAQRGTRGARGRRPRLAVAAAIAVLALLAACGGSTSRSSPPDNTTTATTAAPDGARPGAALRWAKCPAKALKGLQCTTLTVPLDYADPARGTIGIYLDRHRATGRAIGSLLINPGGPGVSGVDYLPDLLPELGSSITSKLNVVGFDPRGVSRSDPVTCGTGPQLDAELGSDPSPPTAAGFADLLAADRSFAAGCEARSGRILPFVSTVDAARDMDRIRAAVGDAKLTYLGFSYGTLLGATYAQLFPTHVRAMVLDGAIDPALQPVPMEQTQAEALDGQLDAFLAACRSGSCGWHPAGDPAGAFAALLAQVRAHPIPVAGSGQAVGPAALLYAAAYALYNPSTWSLLGRALTELQAGNGAVVLAIFDGYVGRSPTGTYSNEVEAEAAVDCLDAPAPTVAQLRADAPATMRLAPVFGLLVLYSEVTCSLWPVPATGRPGPVSAAGSPPIVVVGSTDDPITPYAWARSLARELSHGVLLTRTGYGHTAYGRSRCVRADVNRYLLTTTPPPAGTMCASS